MKQRELKFRVWDSVEKEMLFPETITPSVAQLQGVTIMQFTGLLDKEGKEIYEGDILEATRQTHEKQPLRDGNKYSKVVFEDGSFMASQSVQLNSKKIYTHGYIVIGNLYANPELLKQTP